ncbi:MAG: hypothetical protein IH600_15070 [Bacteroidetes bacterium]|nr:hypothetical protein [Bacteroidota bacterium]
MSTNNAGMTPQDFKMDQSLETAEGRQREIDSTGDWDAEGDSFLEMLNDTSAPNGDTGLQPSSQDNQQQHTQQPVQQTDSSQGTATPPQSAQPQSAQQTGQQTSQQQTLQQQTLQQTPQAQSQQAGQPATTAQPDSIESLRAQLQQFEEVKQFMQTQEYRDSQIIMKGFREDPKGFYRKYLPTVYNELQREEAVMAAPPEDYAREYTDQALAQKYGEKLQEYDPSEALVPNTVSYNIATDRQLMLQRGLQEYYAERARLDAERNQSITQGKEIGRGILKDFSVPEDKFDAVEQLMNSVELTPEIQFRMAYLYLDSIGKLNEFKSTQQTQQQQQFRPSDDRPAPGVHQIAGGESVQTSAKGTLAEVFPEDMLLGGDW